MILVVNKMARAADGNSQSQKNIIRNDLCKVLSPYTPEQLRLSFLPSHILIALLKERKIWALKALKKQRRVNFCVAVINENEEFFRSEYFVALTNSDGEYMIQRIRKECGYNDK